MKKINLKNLKIVKYFKRKYTSFKYNWDYLCVLNSPFVGLRLKWYFGKIQHGTPYFLPRKWVKMTQKDCEEVLTKDLANAEKYGWSYTTNRTWEYYKNHTKAVQIKYFGFNSTTLGWKIKWEDYRFEWAPCYSLVIFGKQLFVCVLPKMEKVCEDRAIRQDCYWEAYLTYKYRTDKTKLKEERLQETVKQYSCSWGSEKNGYVDYYPFILKNKYKKYYENKLI